ncbi:MAG: 5'-methylthioadenosine/adenosylhomocysteine nucleosidase [Neisseriaceae bacterium]|nr:5'-methylthioadenosine/adenosylhomocysteine nucleosidase [Neisseriaceae bacterium]
MSVALLAAMTAETEPVRALMRDVTQRVEKGLVMQSGWLAEQEVVLVTTGVGKVMAATAATMTLLLASTRPRAMINFGVAGALSPSLSKGDVVVARAVVHHDVDVSAFGYAPGQVVGCPPQFRSDPALLAAAKAGVAALGWECGVGLLASGDQFVQGTDQQARIRLAFTDVVAVDMEAAALAQVCHRFSLPFVAVKAVSDGAGEAARAQFEQDLAQVCGRCALVLPSLLQALSGPALSLAQGRA